MRISQQGVDFICSFEGFKPNPYVDPASGGEPITIGYGTTHYPDGTKVTLKDRPVTTERAKQFVQDHADRFISPWLTTNLPRLNQAQFDSLASFCYNEGLHNLETSTLLKDVKANNSQDILGDFEMWIKAAGRVMKGLQTRRDAEAKLYSTGQYQ